MRLLFLIIDPDRNGKIFFQEFWDLLNKPLEQAVLKMKVLHAASIANYILLAI